MNTYDFYERFPELRFKNTTKRDFAVALDQLLALNVFDLMVDTDSSILEMVKECLIDCWWEDW